jgi:predicted nucleic acid-binding protein
VRFWDSSALVPLLIEEPHSPRVEKLGRDQVPMAVWWGTLLECTAALIRRARGGGITTAECEYGLGALDAMRQYWFVMGPDTALREAAVRAARLHGLRAGDALQLAAALDWVGGRPAGEQLVTFDEDLGAAARLEGFAVLP